MKKELPLFFILKMAVLVGALHYTGIYLYLYWRLANFDKLVHFVGGFLIAFICIIIIYFERMPKVNKYHVIILGLFSALAIGIAWEFFELQAQFTSLSDQHYWLDNGGDIVLDIIGGCMASIYFLSKYGSSTKRIS
ncbi:MAG: seg [Candidatus Paceibacter sp.]|jgi:uncharacterized membrane protein YjdF|nr:seg [Candidatus Paceibacter sp.]